jgi:hypothetical protein
MLRPPPGSHVPRLKVQRIDLEFSQLGHDFFGKEPERVQRLLLVNSPKVNSPEKVSAPAWSAISRTSKWLL